MARRVASPRFVGRSEELADLAAGLDRAVAGEAVAILIGGEAGVGKSRLLSELDARARAAGALVARGSCVALSAGALPLLPVAEALRRLAECDDDGVRAVLTQAPPELAPLLPRWGDAPAADRAVSPEALFEHLLTLLRHVSRATPLVLTIEDAHWADRSTLDLLGFLFRTLGNARVLLAVTYRDDEVDGAGLRTWLGEAARVPSVERLPLGRFPHERIAELLAGILGAPASPELAARIFARSEGNAFMAEELLAAARAGGSDEIPETLRDTLLARLGRLTDGARPVVLAASAAGGPVHHRALAQVAGRAAAEVDLVVADAVRQHVLVVNGPTGRVAFRHALLRDVAYEQLLPAERERIHRGFADAFEGEPDLAGGSAATVAAEIAHHALESGDLPRALVSAVSAGVEAERLHASAEALRQFERALALWDRAGGTAAPELGRAEVAARAAAAAEACGVAGRAVELVEQAISLVTDPLRSALLHERLAWYIDIQGHEAAALDAFASAIRLLPDGPSPERAHVLASSAYVLGRAFRIPEAKACAEEALEVARRVGAEAEEGSALIALGAVHTAMSELEENVECNRRALEIARRLGDGTDAARAAINLSDGLLAVGRAAESLEVAREAAEHCRRTGLELSYGGIAETNAALALMQLGRWDEADGLLAGAIARRVAGLGAASLHAIRAQLTALRGDFDAADAHFRLAPELVAGSLPTDWEWELACARAERALWSGEPAAAARTLAAPRAATTETGEAMFLLRVCVLAARAHTDCAEALRRRDREGAGREVDRAREVAETARTSAGYVGPEQRALRAVVAAESSRAEGPADPALWTAAVAECESWGDVYRAAYARWRLGEALLAARAPRAEALEALRPAVEAASRLRANPLLEEIEALARRARLDLARPAAPPPEPDAWGLTAREREVLAHVARGETNRQIADALFISVKTAGVHVSSILRKLDASTRAEAAGIAHRSGVLEDGPRRGNAHRV